MDPITLISTITAGLKLIEQFRETTLRVMGRIGSEPSVTVEAKSSGTAQVETATPTQPDQLEIRRNGQLAERVRAADLKMGEWDEQRYETLRSVVSLLFEQYNALEKGYVLASGLPQIQIKQQMDQIKVQLCPKFREMLALYERTLGVPLGDHFALQGICNS